MYRDKLILNILYQVHENQLTRNTCYGVRKKNRPNFRGIYGRI